MPHINKTFCYPGNCSPGVFSDGVASDQRFIAYCRVSLSHINMYPTWFWRYDPKTCLYPLTLIFLCHLSHIYYVLEIPSLWHYFRNILAHWKGETINILVAFTSFFHVSLNTKGKQQIPRTSNDLFLVSYIWCKNRNCNYSIISITWYCMLKTILKYSDMFNMQTHKHTHTLTWMYTHALAHPTCHLPRHQPLFSLQMSLLSSVYLINNYLYLF